MQTRLVILALGPFIVFGVGCAKPVPPMLHRMEAYAGEIRVQSDGQPDVVCDLAFARAAGSFQVKFSRGKRVVTVVRGAEDAVTTFENAEERQADATEKATLRLVADLCNPARVEKVDATANSYRVRRTGRWYRLKLESQTKVRVHGEPR